MDGSLVRLVESCSLKSPLLAASFLLCEERKILQDRYSEHLPTCWNDADSGALDRLALVDWLHLFGEVIIVRRPGDRTQVPGQELCQNLMRGSGLPRIGLVHYNTG